MNSKQLYRMRAPASGREALADAEPGAVYVDRETGEEMEPVAMVLPLAPSASALPRTPENLRACRRCDQLIGLDVSDCPYCGLASALEPRKRRLTKHPRTQGACVLCTERPRTPECAGQAPLTTVAV